MTHDVALAKAIGESLERYCASVYNPAQVKVATYPELGETATDPRRFLLFHPLQERSAMFPYARLTKASRLGWVQAFSLTRNEPTLVPATMVHLPYQPLTPDDRFEVCPLSGYACGNTLEEAILRGLCEVVERDAFMIFWYHWLPVPAIDLMSLTTSEVIKALARFQGSPVHLFCSSLTTDVGIPVALCALTSRRSGWPATTVAMSAGLCMETAVAGALAELSANLLLVSSHLQYPQRSVPRSPYEVLEMEDHGLFYAWPQMLPALDPLLRPGWSVAARDLSLPVSGDVKANVDQCVRRLAHCDVEVIAVDITVPEVEEQGFRVVKVLAPGMRPIDFGTRWPHLGGQRLYQAPLRMGYRTAKRDPWQLNLFPHPFP
jgi:ribosomal protein S12 methylthiotransferase accessory factor